MALEIGDQIPQFKLNNQEGSLFLSENLKGSYAVVFFYPKNFTPGCTKEVCSFRDSYEDFLTIGAKVIGISSDTQSSHVKFTNRYKLPYSLLADSNGKVRKQFGVKSTLLGLLPGRETFIFSPEGVLIYKIAAMAAAPHIEKALRFIKKHTLK